MSKKQLVIQHDLSKLSVEQLEQYLRDVSEFIGLDPNLNALDTIWMQNESGPGQSLVVYARRGTAEILRNQMALEVSSLTQTITPQGAIVFTAIGKNSMGRQEIAIGSKYVAGLQGKVLDDAIMTASTRALRRLTMQFTSLGILDESEVGAIKGSTVNPAASATLAGSPVVLPPAPQVPANNAPGKDITVLGLAPPLPVAPTLIDQKANIAQVYTEGAQALAEMITPRSAETSAEAAISAAIHIPETPVTSVVAPLTGDFQPNIKAAEKPKRARKAPKTVSLDGPEPEVVSNSPVAPPLAPLVLPQMFVPQSALFPTEAAQAVAAISGQANPAVPVSGTLVPNQGTDFVGKPNDAQMADYRKRVGVYTAELPSSENMGSVQKMRAFITRNSGAAPQFMTTDQWEEMLAWFEAFVAKNAIKGLVKYINDSLGVK